MSSENFEQFLDEAVSGVRKKKVVLDYLEQRAIDQKLGEVLVKVGDHIVEYPPGLHDGVIAAEFAEKFKKAVNETHVAFIRKKAYGELPKKAPPPRAVSHNREEFDALLRQVGSIQKTVDALVETNSAHLRSLNELTKKTEEALRRVDKLAEANNTTALEAKRHAQSTGTELARFEQTLKEHGTQIAALRLAAKHSK